MIGFKIKKKNCPVAGKNKNWTMEKMEEQEDLLLKFVCGHF